jgi:hypothetical protein
MRIGSARCMRASPNRPSNEEIIMETAQLIQAAASIVGAMAASQYGKFGGMDQTKITDIATIAVKIARAIEIAATAKP